MGFGVTSLIYKSYSIFVPDMKRALLYFFIGTAASFALNHFLLGLKGVYKDLYHAVAFGLGWAMAYLVDRPQWPLAKKLGVSLVGIAVLLAAGLLLFDVETAVPSVIKFSTVFVAYYLAASFRESKSLRQ